VRLPHFSGLMPEADRKVRRYCQINIAEDRLIGGRKQLWMTFAGSEYLDRCREHIEFIKRTVVDMRLFTSIR